MSRGEAFDPDIIPATSGGPAVDILRGGAAIAKAENDSLIAMAVVRPRDPSRALARAMAELEMDPEFAATNYYVIPYKNADGTTTNIEGMSLKAAMALARAWGNLTVSARQIDEDDDAILVEGVAIDLETLFRVSKVGSVSKWYRDRRTKKMVQWRTDRMPQLLAAAASKQVRNAILNILPEPMQRRYYARAKEIAAGVKAGAKPGALKKAAPKTIIAAMVKAFSPYGVGLDHLISKVLTAPLAEGEVYELTNDDIGTLRGIWNALEQGQTTVQDAFPGVAPDVPADDTNETTTAWPDVASPLAGPKK